MSDYIPRLREELLRAGAAERRRRWWPVLSPPRTLRPLAPVVGAALLALIVVLAIAPGRSDERAVHRTDGRFKNAYRVEPAGERTAAQTAEVLRARLAAAGVDGVSVSVASDEGVTVAGPDSAREAVSALMAPGRLAIYDWERHVRGAGGAPDERSAAGDPLAAGVTRAEAEDRAAARPDGRVVSDEAAGLWFAITDDPAVTDADVAGATPATDDAAREPMVEIELTEGGRVAFNALTRALARRGVERASDGAGGLEAFKHFAIVLDDRILAVPFIDHVDAPDDGERPVDLRIQGGLTDQSAARIAAILDAGPLPAALEAR